MLFDERAGVLISANALCESGFDVVFPELDGEDAFDETARELDLIVSLGPHRVIPGHGAPIAEAPAAGTLQTACRRSTIDR